MSLVEPVTERTRVALSRVAAAVLVVAPAAVLTWAFRPGYMNADSLTEYAVTQPGGRFTDWRAPLLEKLWDAFETAGIGSPTVVLFAQSLTLTAGLYLVLRAVLPRVPAALLGAVLVFSPIVLSQIQLVARDTWLICFVVLQVGCAIRWSTTSGRWSRVWLALALVAGLMALASRQNAAIFELFVLTGMAARWYAGRNPDRSRLQGTAVPAVVGAVACVLGFALVTALPRIMGAEDLEPETFVYAYDLTGMSLRENEILIGPEAFPSQDLDALETRWHPIAVESVVVPVGDAPVDVLDTHSRALDELREAWGREVRERPGAYLAVRWELFARIIGTSHPPSTVMHHGVDTNGWGLEIENPGANDAFRDYVRFFSGGEDFSEGGWLFRPVVWIGVGLLAAAGLLLPSSIRARPGALECGLLAVAGVVFEAAYFFLAMSESFRYSYPMIVSSLLAAVFLAATAARTPRSRPSGPDQTAATLPSPSSDVPAESVRPTVPSTVASMRPVATPRRRATTAAAITSMIRKIGTAIDVYRKVAAMALTDSVARLNHTTRTMRTAGSLTPR
jgi:hypothetical protein